MIDLYKKVKYAGITWIIIKQEKASVNKKKEWIDDIEKDFIKNETSLQQDDNSFEEIIDEESIITMVAETLVADAHFDIKKNEYENSNIKKVLNNDIKPKLLKKMGNKAENIELRLLREKEFEQIKNDGIKLSNTKDWWLEDANMWTTNYVACVNKSGDVFYECVFYYNGIRPVMSIPFMYLSEKQQAFLKSNIITEEIPTEEESIESPIDIVLDEAEEKTQKEEQEEIQEEPVMDMEPESEVIEKEDVEINIEPPSPLIYPTLPEPVAPKKKKIKYKNKRIKLSTEDIENLQNYYETLFKDETIDEKIRASLMDTLSQLI